MDLSLSFYDVTENTNEDSFKNEESNIILNHIVEKLKDSAIKEATIVEIILPETITGKTIEKIYQIAKYFIVLCMHNYVVFISVPEQINDGMAVTVLLDKLSFNLTSISSHNNLFILSNCEQFILF